MYKRKRPALLVVGLILVAIVGYFIVLAVSPSQKAKRVVDEFYSFEQEGNFGDSWNLLHSVMKKKWLKTTYITDRSHVFIGHFGADTFEYSIGDAEKVSGWRMSKDTPVFKKAYKFEVIQEYRGKYGNFAFLQYVYVVKNKRGDYEIIWDYNQ
ncbi:hypothetical protein A8F94_07945 [Bacillus sp. FJAT-27225]|uniref:hypothetical protein n=1 Tax=Bacillus sp. FJAT-27225 TaxID=1743144 RepID=UPI00080C28FC|nr:hypothetical protein [Bacillus sp. FJAT-27225]OCA87771.1 hypothetical protein A8F94_07945 [Bacillus sp. FJAT-27225]